MKDAASVALAAGVAAVVTVVVIRRQDPVRVRARAPFQLRGRDLVDHAREWAAREAEWQATRAEFQRRQDEHLARCQRRWIAAGWHPPQQERGPALHLIRPGSVG